jgi:hypothetical protein
MQSEKSLRPISIETTPKSCRHAIERDCQRRANADRVDVAAADETADGARRYSEQSRSLIE